jgi:hypothetical protein
MPIHMALPTAGASGAAEDRRSAPGLRGGFVYLWHTSEAILYTFYPEQRFTFLNPPRVLKTERQPPFALKIRNRDTPLPSLRTEQENNISHRSWKVKDKVPKTVLGRTIPRCPIEYTHEIPRRRPDSTRDNTMRYYAVVSFGVSN